MGHGCLRRYFVCDILLIKTDKTEKAIELFNRLNPIASVTVYEESFYTGLRIIAQKRLNIKNMLMLSGIL
ncbi:hypothetical protein AFULGI_00024870 [Archaeoglobus fulgidus DSM 8774]|jgi:hypothetical protein|uniref:Uncharacterized protein n=1 Tax=Archaeoglobus fulgidus DSM 8774 TaxID=1344584 RepID=A0A075WHD3_ARCFL|nr:hypothetical protein AFULGI_00024870 [Archaeoglobus fulgidus DSM 8774]